MTSIYRKMEDLTQADITALREHHNTAAGEIVKAIVRPIVELGGTEGDALVMLESVITGVLLTMDPKGDQIRLFRMGFGVSQRLDEIREQNRKRAMT